MDTHTRLIYRIETEDGRGAYKASSFEYDPVRHPAPYEDSKLAPFWMDLGPQQKDYFFGFGSQEQLRAWFYSDHMLLNLKRDGCHLSVYEVSIKESHIGYSQAVFKKASAQLIETRPLI
jgi:hypothetical protein